jgi:transcriptional regulator with XRE-family HTH domain
VEESESIDVDELRRRVGDYRRERRLSLRAAAEESGVPLNTLSRVEKGQLPDLANFGRLVTWIGLDPATVFGSAPRQRAQSTPDAIRSSLHSDPYLTEHAANQIAELVSNLYANLATTPRRARLHLRVTKTFTPPAARQLGDLLENLQTALLADDAIGTNYGWNEED